MKKDPAFRRVEKMLYDYKTYGLAIKNLTQELKSLDDSALVDKIADKNKNKTRLEEAAQIFTSEELIIWNERYIKDIDVSVLIDRYGWSRTTYFRLRRGLVLKVMKCLGEL